MNSISTINNMPYLIVFRLLFAMLRPVKRKYNLTVNHILVINSCYLYSKLTSETFYITDILKFNSYFNNVLMNRYFKDLNFSGFLLSIQTGKNKTKYKLTAKGIEVIESIDQYYNSELYSFYNKYNIQ